MGAQIPPHCRLATPQDVFSPFEAADLAAYPPSPIYLPNLAWDLLGTETSAAGAMALQITELAAKGPGARICLLIIMTWYHSLRAGIYLSDRGRVPRGIRVRFCSVSWLRSPGIRNDSVHWAGKRCT